MTGLNNLKQPHVIRTFERMGWRKAREGDRHIIMSHPNRPGLLVIPRHKVIAPGTMRSILKAAGITLNDFVGEDV